MKYCKDYPGAPSCCISCHEDEIDGYGPLCEITTGGGYTGSDVVAYVCCAVSDFASKAEAAEAAEAAAKQP